MLLKLTHETTLKYSDAITETLMELRMAPRQASSQMRVSFNLAVGPPAGVWTYFDWLGNQVHAFSIIPPHSEVRIVAKTIVETQSEQPNLASITDEYPVNPQDYTFSDYLQFGGPVVDCPKLHELVAELETSRGTPMALLVMQMLHLIHSQFTYEKGVTTASTPISDVLEHRRGVCQDFTHLMIGMARVLKIPARYVSGIVHAGNASLRGAAQTHAWCELYFPSVGWLGLDPTNKTLVNDHFVITAIGRDYRDVPPNRGVYKGKAKESIQVAVTTEELRQVPQHLPGERIETLRIGLLQEAAPIVSGRIAQLEEQQQQQQQEGGQLHQQQQQQQQQQ